MTGCGNGPEQAKRRTERDVTRQQCEHRKYVQKETCSELNLRPRIGHMDRVVRMLRTFFRILRMAAYQIPSRGSRFLLRTFLLLMVEHYVAPSSLGSYRDVVLLSR